MYEFSNAYMEDMFWADMQGLAAKASAGDMQALQGLMHRLSKLSRILGNATYQTHGTGHNHFDGSCGGHSHSHC